MNLREIFKAHSVTRVRRGEGFAPFTILRYNHFENSVDIEYDNGHRMEKTQNKAILVIEDASFEVLPLLEK